MTFLEDWLGRDVARWATPALIALSAFAIGWLAMRIVHRLLARAADHTNARWDDALVTAAGRPLGLGIGIVAMWIALPWIPFDGAGRPIATGMLLIASVAAAGWLAVRLVDVGHELLAGRPWAASQPAARSLLAMTRRVIKLAILVCAAIVALSMLGVPVTSLVAGLGIGGLALALAAQKTVENLFGTLSIGIDQPLREGDFVKIGEVVGTVEAIGLRSTRVRTLDRTLVTIPNGGLADTPIESYTVRDRLRLACTLGLVYESSAPQLRAILADLEATLRAHPLIWPDAVIVRFAGFGASSLDVEIMAWFMTTDWNEFTAVRQELLLEFMSVVARRQSAFAFPTRTLHVVADTPTHEVWPPTRGTTTRPG